MIAFLRGRLLEADADGLVIEVGGVGLRVHASAAAVRAAQDAPGNVRLQTHLVVREDALQLYGFGSASEREMFELLLGVSGVGPKVALGIVSGSTPEELRRAIARDDLARFEAIPGVGRKTAQRVVLELKDKLPFADVVGAGARDELTARDALVELGWSLTDADRALADVDETLPVEEQVRAALRKAA